MPSNAGYLVAAYIATAVVYSLYGFSIVVRTRRLRARLAASAHTDGTG
jgi:hypothetical protein